MPIYKGSIIRKFILDRLAVGIPNKALKDEFVQTFGESLWFDNIIDQLKFTEVEIKQREEMLAEEYISTSFADKLHSMLDDMEAMMEEARASGDVRSYSSISPQYIKTLDMIEKIIEKGKLSNKKYVDEIEENKRNLKTLQLLESQGVIKIKNENKLKTLLGV